MNGPKYSIFTHLTRGKFLYSQFDKTRVVEKKEGRLSITTRSSSSIKGRAAVNSISGWTRVTAPPPQPANKLELCRLYIHAFRARCCASTFINPYYDARVLFFLRCKRAYSRILFFTAVWNRAREMARFFQNFLQSELSWRQNEYGH